MRSKPLPISIGAWKSLAHCLLIALLLTGNALLAQAGPDSSLEDLMNLKVSTASRYLQSAKDAPAMSTVITREDIQNFGYRTIADALQSIPGFFITNDHNYSYVNVRGFGRPSDYNTKILLLVDGHRMNDAIYDQATVGTESPIDIDLVERIEVIRGPGASLYGTSAFFAVINVITRTVPRGTRVETAVDGESLGGMRGRVTLSSKLHDSDVLASATLYRSEGADLYFPEVGAGTSGADYDSSGQFFLRAHRGNWSLLTLYSSRDKGVPTGAFDTALSVNGTHTIDDRGVVEISHKGEFGNWKANIRAAYDAYTYSGTYIGIPDDSGTSIAGHDYSRSDTLSGEVSLSRQVHQRHFFTLGTELRANLRQAQGYYDLNPFRTWLKDNRQSMVTAGFIQDEYRPWRFLLLNLGVRVDEYSSSGTNVSPRLAVIWQPNTRTAVKAIYGNAFRAPNVFEMYYSASLNYATNPNLSSEHIQTGELVLEHDITSRSRITASAFRNNISGLISQTTEDDLILYRNLEKVRSTGLDLQLEGTLRNGALARAAYTYVDTENAGTSSALPNSPHSLLKGSLSIPVANQLFRASMNATWVGRRNTMQVGSVDPYAKVDFTLLLHKSASPWTAAASIYNLFNAAYSDPGAAEHIQKALPQYGRTFRLKLSYYWGLQR